LAEDLGANRVPESMTPASAKGFAQNRAEPTRSSADGEFVSPSPLGETNLSVPSRAKVSCQPWSCHR
jgi:hypothetical protein